MWDVDSGQQKASLEGYTNGVRSVAFSPDGTTLASGGGTVRLWDVDSGQQKASLEGYTNGVRSVAFSPDGTTLASGGDTIRLWDVDSGQQKASLKGHTNRVRSVAFSPDGTTLASGGGTVRLWDVGSGQQKAALEGHSDFVHSVAFSLDGRTLASGSRDGTVLLWDTGDAPTHITEVATPEVPATSGLEPNVPNPFNASTRIAYRLANPGPVRLEIYNTLGQSVRTLVDEVQAAGVYQVRWDARDQRGAAVATGVYLTRLHYPGGVQTRQLLLLK